MLAGTSYSAVAGFPFFLLISSSSCANGEKEDEEGGNVAMPVVIPLTGNDFKKNDALPLLTCSSFPVSYDHYYIMWPVFH